MKISRKHLAKKSKVRCATRPIEGDLQFLTARRIYELFSNLWLDHQLLIKSIQIQISNYNDLVSKILSNEPNERQKKLNYNDFKTCELELRFDGNSIFNDHNDCTIFQ